MTFSRTETVSRRRTPGPAKCSRLVHAGHVKLPWWGCGMVSGLSGHSAVARGAVPGASVSAAPRPSFDTVLETKLHIPPVRKDWVKRQVLVHCLLMRTAVPSRFTAPLCGAVTGTVNSWDVLNRLERENMFLIALDDKREWHRYHHLFAQLLLGQLDRAEPGVIPALHQRASAWYLERGSAGEAIGHALAAGDFTRSAALIAQRWCRYMDAGRVATVRSWLRSLGDDNIRTNPPAAHSAASVAAPTGDREAVSRWLPVVAAGGDQGPLPDGIRFLRSSPRCWTGLSEPTGWPGCACRRPRPSSWKPTRRHRGMGWPGPATVRRSTTVARLRRRRGS